MALGWRGAQTIMRVVRGASRSSPPVWHGPPGAPRETMISHEAREKNRHLVQVMSEGP